MAQLLYFPYRGIANGAQEAHTRKIRVHDTEVDTLKRMITFMYIGSYDDDKIDQSLFAMSEGSVNGEDDVSTAPGEQVFFP